MINKLGIVTQPSLLEIEERSQSKAKPFLKWAGGKGQLIGQFVPFLPPELKEGKIKRYVEPFVGGGAVFFFVVQNYSVDEFFISDMNEELMLAYMTIQRDVEGVIQRLAEMEQKYLSLGSERRKKFFYDERSRLNANLAQFDFKSYHESWVDRTAQIIFLNRTCYNGLFRVNSKGEFNVPFGDYRNPRICDAGNLRAVARVLQRATIESGDFTICDEVVDSRSFVYLDPPYRPITKTASFTSYSRYDFDDEAQERLAGFYKHLDSKHAKLMLSNSDPKNGHSDHGFFERLYFGFSINKVKAARMINCVASKRGAITELIITNY